MKLKIGPYIYKVKKKKLKRKYGTCDFRTHTIELDPDQTAGALRDTILHEVLHAVDDVAGNRQREGETRRRATILLMVLRDNPELRRILFKQ